MTVTFFDHVWQSTLFAAAVALLTLAFRDHRAGVRYGLWLVASVKFLVPWTVLASAGSLVAWPHAPAPMRTLVASSAARTAQLPFVRLPPCRSLSARRKNILLVPTLFCCHSLLTLNQNPAYISCSGARFI